MTKRADGGERGVRRAGGEQAVARSRNAPVGLEGARPDDLETVVQDLRARHAELVTEIDLLRRANAELIESQHRYADHYESAPVAYVTLDDQGVIHEANLTAEIMLGVGRGELLGLNLSDFVDPQTKWTFRKNCRQTSVCDPKCVCDIVVRRADGSGLIAQMESVPCRKSSERTGRFRAALVDVTARRNAENALRQLTGVLDQRVAERTCELERTLRDRDDEVARRRRTEASLRREHELVRAMVQTAQAIILLLDGDGRILAFNDYMADLCGFRIDEVRSRDWFETFLPREDRDETRRRFRGAVAGEQTKGHTNPILTRDGRRRVIQWDDAPITDDEGRFIGLLCTGHDVTEQRQAARMLSERTDQLSAILTTATDAIITIDEHGIILGANPATERMFGFPMSELIGSKLGMLMPEQLRAEHNRGLAEYRATGRTSVIGAGCEVEGQRKDGSTFPIDVAVSRIEHLGLFTGIIRDISERKAADERLRCSDRLASIGTLAAGLGHDMNNILLPVRARLDIIEQQEQTEVTREQFTEIRRSVKYLQDLSDGLRLLALDPSDPLASSPSTSLPLWWEQVRSILGKAVGKRVRFEVALPDDAPAIAVAPHRLTQAILNLLVNANTAVGETGSIRLWAQHDADRNTIRIGVTDNGCGMTQEIRERALEPFFTTRKRGVGTGLGLSLVHGVAQSAGGDVHIDSEVGHGTTIALTLPIVVRPIEDTMGRPPPLALVTVRDPRVGSFISQLLELEGYEVSRDPLMVGGETCLLVTDAGAPGSEATDSLTRRIIVLGAEAGGGSTPGVHVVEDPGSFADLRRTIGLVARQGSR